MLHRESMSYPSESVSFYPNAFGEPTKVLGNTTYANNVSYHANGAIRQFDYGNGIRHNTYLNSSTQLPYRIQDMNGGSRINYLSYTFDNNANIKSILDGVSSAHSITNFNYDGLDRLTSTVGNSAVGNSSMQYDSLGNMTYFTNTARTLDYSYSYSTNRLNAVNSWGATPKSYTSLSYDSRGNVTHNSHFSMTYNLANQMTAANGTSYLYDGHNRRVRINSNEFNVYSKEGKLLLRKDSSGETQYVYLGNRLVGKRTGSTVKYVHTDMLGSSTVETNTNKSLAGSRNYYRAYGETIGAAQDDVGYTGHLFDSETGLNYMQARYYDPVIGRFMSNDPVDALKHLSTPNGIHGFNRYAYANNNPYKYTDPDGRETNPVSGNSYIKDSELRTNKTNPNVGKHGPTRTDSKGNIRQHHGVDIAAPNGTPLVAPISGKVQTLTGSPKGGNVVWIEGVGTGKNAGDTVKIGMAHLDSLSVKTGDVVNAGDPLGTAGSTGNAAGMPASEEHVHLSVRVNGSLVDPQTHFQNNPKP